MKACRPRGCIDGPGRIGDGAEARCAAQSMIDQMIHHGFDVRGGDVNDRVLPFSEEHGVRMLRILTDRGSEYCGNRETHEYALYLDIENIEHTHTKTKSPQTNGICERFHQTIQNEFYASAFRRKHRSPRPLANPEIPAALRRCRDWLQRTRGSSVTASRLPWLDSKWGA